MIGLLSYLWFIQWDYDDTCSGLSYMFNIEPVRDWTKSLIEVGK